MIYSAKGLCAAADVTYRQIHYWTERGYLIPISLVGEPTSGTGTRRVYGEESVRRARLLGALLSPGSVVDVLGVLLREGRVEVPGFTLILEERAG